MKAANTILLLGAGAGLIALRNRTAKVGAIYKEIPNEFYPCVDGTYSDHNRNRACTRHGGLITDEAIRLCNGVELEGSELQVHNIPVNSTSFIYAVVQPNYQNLVSVILGIISSGTLPTNLIFNGLVKVGPVEIPFDTGARIAGFKEKFLLATSLTPWPIL